MKKNVIWVFWMGGVFTENRKRNFKSLIDNSDCEIKLINKENLLDYEIKNSPLHPAFPYLSSVHQSDVLRSYFMCHYGGGYTDIKNCEYSWKPYFEKLNNSDYSFMGYYEKSRSDIAMQCSNKVKDKWKTIVGNGNFIFKKNTDFAKEWLEKTNLVLDEKYNTLKENPGWYHPRSVTGGIHKMDANDFKSFRSEYKTDKYPIEWSELMGAIFQTLQYENQGTYMGGLPYVDARNYL